MSMYRSVASPYVHDEIYMPPLARAAHASHSLRCITGLPDSLVDVDASRLALAFYCIGSLDILELLNEKVNTITRNEWRKWFWEQQTSGPHGGGFKPSSFMTGQGTASEFEESPEYSCPHVIMTYTALLSLAILRDDFAGLDRPGIVAFLRGCQREDGSFRTTPQGTESDLRTVYCAFAISSMLDDWSGVDVDRAKAFIASCRTYEGGYGQEPSCEAQGGTTYTAIAALYLAPRSDGEEPLTAAEREQTARWLSSNQDESGGFRGRTGKAADACYCFWCGATLRILGRDDLVDGLALVKFLDRCQFKFGGISKAPDEHPDPYHTYLSLAAIAMYPPPLGESGSNTSWHLAPIDPLLNATQATARWIRDHVPRRS